MITLQTLQRLAKATGEPSWFTERRKEAFAAYQQLADPSFKYGIGIFVNPKKLDFKRIALQPRTSFSVSVQDNRVQVLSLAQALENKSIAQKLVFSDLAKGDKIGAFGLTEANAGSDAAALETTAVKDGNDYILNGTKIFITDGGVADVIIVFATVNKELGHRGITAFIVEKDFPGYSVGSRFLKAGMRACPQNERVATAR